MKAQKYSKASTCARRSILAAFCAVLVSNSIAAMYSTTFTHTENPISQDGHWIHGAEVGLDWSNCVTSGGIVHGRQNNGGGPNYNDSTALLSGTWASNQSVTVTFYKTNVVENDYPEVEIRLRSALSAHSCTGYEICWSLRTDSSCYVSITRWNGPFGSFTNVAAVYGSQYAITNGAILKAVAVQDSISAYVNGVKIL